VPKRRSTSHARKIRLPVLVNNLARKSVRGLDCARTIVRDTKHECEKCAGADHPMNGRVFIFFARGSFRTNVRFYSEWLAGKQISSKGESVCLFNTNIPSPKSVRSSTLYDEDISHRGLPSRALQDGDGPSIFRRRSRFLLGGVNKFSGFEISRGRHI